MPKKKSIIKTNYLLDKSFLKTVGISLSILINAAVIIVLIVARIDWTKGDVNVLTGGIQQSTCGNFFNKTSSSINTGKTIKIGDVSFIPSYFSPSQLNSDCLSYAQANIFFELTEANNPAATSYYDNLLNFHLDIPSGQQFLIPINYNSATKQPTLFPY